MNLPNSLMDQFPPLRSAHTGRWLPVYLEPIVGSGERLCIAVAASDGDSNVVELVPSLARLSQVYGASGAQALAWSAELAVDELKHRLSITSLDEVLSAPIEVEGLSFGGIRMGAGLDLQDLAKLALKQVSALVGADPEPLPIVVAEPPDYVGYMVASSESSGDVERRVRSRIIAIRPELKSRFGLAIRPSQTARDVRFGFISAQIAANFAALAASSKRGQSLQVDRAKARLWDLHQLQSGALAGSFPDGSSSREHELLVFSPHGHAARRSKARTTEGRLAIEAEDELEAEADKVEIRFRPKATIEDIADYVLQKAA